MCSGSSITQKLHNVPWLGVCLCTKGKVAGHLFLLDEKAKKYQPLKRKLSALEIYVEFHAYPLSKDMYFLYEDQCHKDTHIKKVILICFYSSREKKHSDLQLEL